jgi:hypothetical protein
MPIGKATASPAISIAATRSRLARLKIMPPVKAKTARYGGGIENILEERPSCVSQTAEGYTPQQSAGNDAHNIVPVKKLESVTRAELDCIGPGTAAEHAGDHQRESDRIRFRLIQGSAPLSDSSTKFPLRASPATRLIGLTTGVPIAKAKAADHSGAFSPAAPLPVKINLNDAVCPMTEC